MMLNENTFTHIAIATTTTVLDFTDHVINDRTKKPVSTFA